MNFEFAEKINPYLEKLEFEKAISIAESELKNIPTTDFHSVIGISLIDQAAGLANWTEGFYKLAGKQFSVKSLYFEMNEFDINTDLWFVDIFAYNHDGGLDIHDMEWLVDYETDSRTESENHVYPINGLEKLQKAFETINLDNDELQNARDWCEQIIIARFMEFMRACHLNAKKENYGWASIPIYFTEHSYDFIVRSKLEN